MRGYAGHPLSAAFTAWISSLTVTSPLPSVSIAVQVSSDALPKAMFTAVIRLLTVTCPSLSQSPAHGAVTVHAQASAHVVAASLLHCWSQTPPEQHGPSVSQTQSSHALRVQPPGSCT